jgi:membrane associated rhomboid family serine protease
VEEPTNEPATDSELTRCYRHGDRRAGVICQRCDRPICPSCMTQASVGFHCPECVKRGSQRVIKAPQLAFRPLATQVLIGLNLVGFVWGVAVGRSAGRLGSEALADGALFSAARRIDPNGTTTLLGVDQGEWWRLVSSAFLHSGLLHLGMNMAALWILGSQLERALGPARFVSVYVVSMFAGAFGVLLLDPNTFTVGASGAVFGLMGVAVMIQRAAGINPWASGIGGLILINVIITFAIPAISIGGHVGGLAGGLIAGGFTVEAIRRRLSLTTSLAFMVVLAAAFAAGGIWAATMWSDPIF